MVVKFSFNEEIVPESGLNVTLSPGLLFLEGKSFSRKKLNNIYLIQTKFL